MRARDSSPALSECRQSDTVSVVRTSHPSVQNMWSSPQNLKKRCKLYQIKIMFRWRRQQWFICYSALMCPYVTCVSPSLEMVVLSLLVNVFMYHCMAPRGSWGPSARRFFRFLCFPPQAGVLLEWSSWSDPSRAAPVRRAIYKIADPTQTLCLLGCREPLCHLNRNILDYCRSKNNVRGFFFFFWTPKCIIQLQLWWTFHAFFFLRL